MSASQDQDVSVAGPPFDQVRRVTERYFEIRNHELLVGNIAVSNLVEEFGSPLFVYDQGIIKRKIDEVREFLPPNFDLYYSIKANPNASLLRLFLQQDCGLEVASGGELFQALNAGCPPERLIFAGPGKTRSELAAAVQASIREIHVESLEEAHYINELAAETEQVTPIALRINPVDAAGGAMRMGGQASPFGIDEEDLDNVLTKLLTMRHLTIEGVHLFMATQILDADILIRQYRRALTIARTVASRLSSPLKTIDFGGGLGTPYFAHETELDLSVVAAGIASVATEMSNDPRLTSARGIIEPGRFLVNEAGVYLARITRVKESRGKTFAVIDGGMHHHLAASGNLGQTIKRNYPVAIVNKMNLPSAHATEVVGPLCTPLDMLARNAKLPQLETGDLFGVLLSGAYARTSSPHGFLSHDSPAEVLVDAGTATLIRRRGNPTDYLRDQCSESKSNFES